MTVSFSRIVISTIACAALALCGVPAAAFAGENVTVAEQTANDAAIQQEIDALDSLEAGEDYVNDQILVTYSGQDEPEALDLEGSQSVQDALESAKDDDMVVAAQPNYVYRLMDSTPAGEGSSSDSGTQTNDPAASAQYYLGPAGEPDGVSYRGANIQAAWDLVKSNASVTVAVLDTGVQTTHDDLAANIDTAHMATVTASGAVRVGTMKDEDGHGTHVAGIVSAAANNKTGIAGASYNATVLPIRVFADHVSTTLQCVAAIEYLDGLVESRQVTNLHVMNMSLGSYGVETSTDKLLREEISHMRKEHEVISVCAGGNGINNRAQTQPCFPADWSECVAVTSLTETGENSRWSDYNVSKDISAPGESILSTITDTYASELKSYGDDSLYVYKKNASYGYMEGTSMAAPLVSGVMALLWATYPQLSASDAVAAVKNTATEVTIVSLRDLTRLALTGSAGLIDAKAAVTYVQNLAQGRGVSCLSNPAPQATVSTTPAKVKGTKATGATRAVKVAWKSIQGTGGYQIRYRLEGSSAWKAKAVKDALATSAKVAGLKQGKSYSVQVRAWRIKPVGNGKLYGAWSATKKAKAK